MKGDPRNPRRGDARSAALYRFSATGELEVLVEGSGAGDVIVPAELAPVSRVELPPMPTRQRAAAALFALEDRLATSVEEMHVALGDGATPGALRVAYCSHAQMQAWLAQARAAGVTPRRMLVDSELIPPPDSETGWSVARDGDRWLVRSGEGDALSVSSEAFDAAWRSAGSPPLTESALLAEWREPGAVRERIAEGLSLAPIDLLQGRYSSRSCTDFRAVRGPAVVVAAIGLAHLGLLAVDTALLERSLAEEREKVVRLLDQVAPESAGAKDPAAALEALYPSAPSRLEPSDFLPRVTTVVQAFGDTETGIGLRGLVFDGTDSSLSLDIEAPDLATLERLERDLVAAGLPAASAGAALRDGGAEATLLIAEKSTETAP